MFLLLEFLAALTLLTSPSFLKYSLLLTSVSHHFPDFLSFSLDIHFFFPRFILFWLLNDRTLQYCPRPLFVLLHLHSHVFQSKTFLSRFISLAQIFLIAVHMPIWIFKISAGVSQSYLMFSFPHIKLFYFPTKPDLLAVFFFSMHFWYLSLLHLFLPNTVYR